MGSTKQRSSTVFGMRSRPTAPTPATARTAAFTSGVTAPASWTSSFKRWSRSCCAHPTTGVTGYTLGGTSPCRDAPSVVPCARGSVREKRLILSHERNVTIKHPPAHPHLRPSELFRQSR
jgi:hypothetical protein